jgi:hypothetical protein
MKILDRFDCTVLQRDYNEVTIEKDEEITQKSKPWD